MGEHKLRVGDPLKPPVVVQIPAMLHPAGDGDETNVVITIVLDKRGKEPLGFQLVQVQEGGNPKKKAMISSVDPIDGLALAWNERHEEDEHIEAGDTILSVNGQKGQFAAMVEELSQNILLEIVIQKPVMPSDEASKNKQKSKYLAQDGQEEQSMEDIMKQLEAQVRERENDHLAMKKMVESTKMKKKGLEDKKQRLEPILDSLQRLASFDPFATSVVCNIVLGIPFCSSCGFSFLAQDGNFCSRCSHPRSELEPECALNITSPDASIVTFELSTCAPPLDEQSTARSARQISSNSQSTVTLANLPPDVEGQRVISGRHPVTRFVARFEDFESLYFQKVSESIKDRGDEHMSPKSDASAQI